VLTHVENFDFPWDRELLAAWAGSSGPGEGAAFGGGVRVLFEDKFYKALVLQTK